MNGSSLTPRVNIAAMVNSYGIRTFQLMTSASYVYSVHTHTHTHTQMYCISNEVLPNNPV